jgi:hypothetical protein
VPATFAPCASGDMLPPASPPGFGECSSLRWTIAISFAADIPHLTFLPATFFGATGRLRRSIWRTVICIAFLVCSSYR